jgi:hypothetical protein
MVDRLEQTGCWIKRTVEAGSPQFGEVAASLRRNHPITGLGGNSGIGREARTAAREVNMHLDCGAKS